jgi:MFS family permease
VLGLIGLGAAGTMFAMPAQAFFPVFARDLQVGPEGLGLIQGAVGFGSLAGVVFLSLQKGERPSAMLLIGGSLAYGVAVTLFALSPVFWLSVLLAFGMGVVGTLFLTINFTMVQLVVPDELRGRVLSIRMVIFGMQPVGQISGGVAAEFITTRFAVALGGLICVGLMLLVLARAPQLRRL